jgi:hypothetical protein
MDWRSMVIFAVVIVALIWLIMRLRGNNRNPAKLQMAMDMISALNDDLKMIRQMQESPTEIKKFKLSNWKLYQEHLDFVEKDYIEPIKDCFGRMSAYNQKFIENKINGNNTRPEIDLEALKTVVVKARAGLAKWIQENVHREATRGLFSWRN